MGSGDKRLGDYFNSRRERGEEGLPTLSVTLDNGLVPRDSLERKTDSNLSPAEHLLVRKGDIVYNMMRMWQGASGLAKHDALISPAYIVLTPKQNMDPHFAAYLFKSARMIYLFWAYSYGLTKDRLRLYFDDFSLIPVTIPPIEEQRRIAKILATWDRAIEATERLIENNKVQKKRLLKQLLSGAKRFSEFKETDWPVKKLGDIAQCFSGGTPPKNNSEYYGGDIPWIKSGEVNKRFIRDAEETITESGLSASSAKIVPSGTVLLAMYGATAGKLAVTEIEAAINQAILAILPTDSIERDFLFFALENEMNRVAKLVQGGQPNLNAGIIKNTKISLPVHLEQTKVAKVISAIESEIILNQRNLDLLKKEKIALMQQLLTGKRRVKVEGGG